jgi:tetratricopeptide (TPR) repeat protein
MSAACVASGGHPTLGPNASQVAYHLHLVGTNRNFFRNQLPGSVVQMARRWRQSSLFEKRPEAMPLLLASIRAARRAVARDGDDSKAWLFLGEAYLALQAQEANYGLSFKLLAELRGAQVSSAFHQALLREPDLGHAHLRLVEYYEHTRYDDLKLKHLRAARKMVPDDPDNANAARVLQDLEDQVRVRTRRLEREMGRMRVLDRAHLAVKLGLAGRAVDLLLASDYSAFGMDGANLQLDLLLATGETRLVDEMVDPPKSKEFGPKRYGWLRAQVALAVGDYEKADTALAGMSDLLIDKKENITIRDFLIGDLTRRVATTIFLSPNQEGGPGSGAFTAITQSIILRNMIPYISELERDAERAALRGLVALEKGDPIEAQRWFKSAIDTWGGPEKAASGAGLDFPARSMVQGWRASLQTAREKPGEQK